VSPDAALEALAGALESRLADDALHAALTALDELHRDGWHLVPDPAPDPHAAAAYRRLTRP
jgi:hypothetical protein